MDEIIDSVFPVDDQTIIEIGSGPCTLTELLLKNFSTKIICIEKDETFKKIGNKIQETYKDRISFIYQDAITVNITDITSDRVIIVSNLPYSSCIPILFNLFSHIQKIDKMILMFQKEVAERICSNTNTKKYGKISVSAQLLCKTRILFDIPNTAFHPVPKVTSSLVEFIPISKISNEFLCKVKQLEKLTFICFQQRRKTIFSILKGTFGSNKLKIELAKLGIDPSSRPESVSPVKFLQLSEALIMIDNSR
jgi:16S rRNA (adenine1518-N6/adenine1519-N6)-dimethyltransferase